MGSEQDFLARLRALLCERAGLRAEQAAEIEQAIAAEFGGRDVYVRRRAKTLRVAQLAQQPPDASAREVAHKVGLSERQVRRLRVLLR
jgi:Mor family transcriptional regulator